MEKISVCPQQIYRFKFPDQKKFLEIKQDLMSEEYKIIQTNFRTTNHFLHKKEKYSFLFQWIHECLDEIKLLQNYQCSRLKVTQSWGNKNIIGQKHHPHYHPNSVVSGIFYLTEGTPTTFASRNYWLVGHPDSGIESYLQLSPDTTNQVVLEDVKYSPGDLLIFPSTFRHCVEKNSTPKDRYTLSFNTFPVGSVGDPAGLTGAFLDVL